MIINLYEASTAINLAPVAFTPPVPPSCDSKPLKISFAVDDYEQTTYDYVWDSTQEKWFVRSNKLGGWEQYGLYANTIAPYEIIEETGAEAVLTGFTDYGWEVSTVSVIDGLNCYQSTNYKKANTNAIMKIIIPANYGDTFTCYLRSYGEASYDYAIVSKLDETECPSSGSDGRTYKHTRGISKSGTALTDYLECTYNIADTSVPHHIWVNYHKDGSGDNYDDRGYILLQSHVLKETGASVYDGKLAIVDGFEYEYQKDKWVNIGALDIDTPPDNAIMEFADPNVQAICASNWGDGTNITYGQARAVTDVNTAFKGNTSITSFDEFRYFTGVTYLNGTFINCTNLTSLTLPYTISSWGTEVVRNCGKLANMKWAPVPNDVTVQPLVQDDRFAGTDFGNYWMGHNDSYFVMPNKPIQWKTDWASYSDKVQRLYLQYKNPNEINQFTFDMGGSRYTDTTQRCGVYVPAEYLDIYTEAVHKIKNVPVYAYDFDADPDNVVGAPETAIVYPKYYDKGSVDTDMAVVDVYCDLYDATENNYIGKEALVTSDGDIYKVGDDKYWQYQYNIKYTIPYTTSNGNIIDTVVTTGWGANFVANIIYDGKPTLVFDNAPTAVPTNAFKGSNLTDINLSDGIVNIYNQAFAQCANLTSITLPSTVQMLNSECFLGSGLRTITLNEGVKNIAYRSFAGCNYLTELIIPSTVTSFGNHILESVNLTKLEVKSRVNDSYDNVFDLNTKTNLTTLLLDGCTRGFNISTSNRLTEQAFVNLFNSLDNAKDTNQTINVGAENIEKLSDATIAIAVNKGYILVGVSNAKMTYTTADNQAVSLSNKWGNARVIANTYTNGVGTIVFDRYPTMIPANEFADSQLATINLPDTITTIGDEALRGTHITDLTINIDIPQKLCLDCFGLTSLTIGNNVTSIGTDAFAGCGLLNNIYAKGKTAPTVANMLDVAEVGTLHCLSVYTDVYTDWIANYLPIGWSVEGYKTSIDDPALFVFKTRAYNPVNLAVIPELPTVLSTDYFDFGDVDGITTRGGDIWAFDSFATKYLSINTYGDLTYDNNATFMRQIKDVDLDCSNIKSLAYALSMDRTNECYQGSHIKLYNCQNVLSYRASFKNCPNLTDFEIDFISKNANVTEILGNQQFSQDSLVNLINALESGANNKSLKIGTNNYNNMTQALKDLATSKGWVVTA